MARTSTYMSMDGVDIGIDYNTANLRFTTVNWSIIASISFRVHIYQDGVEIYTTDLIGPTSGSANVPGNRRLVETIDPIDGHPYLSWPAGLTACVEELH